MESINKKKSISLKEKRRLSLKVKSKRASYIPGGERWKKRTR